MSKTRYILIDPFTQNYSSMSQRSTQTKFREEMQRFVGEFLERDVSVFANIERFIQMTDLKVRYPQHAYGQAVPEMIRSCLVNLVEPDFFETAFLSDSLLSISCLYHSTSIHDSHYSSTHSSHYLGVEQAEILLDSPPESFNRILFSKDQYEVSSEIEGLTEDETFHIAALIYLFLASYASTVYVKSIPALFSLDPTLDQEDMDSAKPIPEYVTRGVLQRIARMHSYGAQFYKLASLPPAARRLAQVESQNAALSLARQQQRERKETKRVAAEEARIEEEVIKEIIEQLPLQRIHVSSHCREIIAKLIQSGHETFESIRASKASLIENKVWDLKAEELDDFQRNLMTATEIKEAEMAAAATSVEEIEKRIRKNRREILKKTAHADNAKQGFNQLHKLAFDMNLFNGKDSGEEEPTSLSLNFGEKD